jgi:hypothetical protein
MSITENATFAPTASYYRGLFSQPISAGLARRLAEAATGYAEEGEVYVTALYTPNYDSEDPYDVQAWQHWQDVPNPLESGYGVFGPFQTTLYGSSQKAQATVEEFQVSISGPTTFSIYPASQYDALFYSAAAVKKFAVPYYSSLYSGAYGDHVLSAFQEAPVALMAHMPWSEYTAVDVVPGDEAVAVEHAITVDRAFTMEPAAAVETPAVMEPTAGSGGEIAVLFVMDDKGNLRPRPLPPLAGHLRGGATPQGSQTPRNAGSRAT